MPSNIIKKLTNSSIHFSLIPIPSQNNYGFVLVPSTFIVLYRFLSSCFSIYSHILQNSISYLFLSQLHQSLFKLSSLMLLPTYISYFYPSSIPNLSCLSEFFICTSLHGSIEYKRLNLTTSFGSYLNRLQRVSPNPKRF